MNFDVKDVKSWVNRYEVKVGDKGYVSSNLYSLQDDLKNNVALIREISRICYDDVECFSCKAFGTIRSYGFFLPLDAVKADKPKEKYRPFKTISELEYELNKVNRSAHQFMCVGNDIFIRNKNKNQITHLIITRIDRDAKTNEILFVNNMSPKTLLDNYEIRVGAEWLPFGIEVKND
jgi:hypothetical protein